MTDISKRLHLSADCMEEAYPIRAAEMREAAREIERLTALKSDDRAQRTGAHLLLTAKQLGWKDDGEGALEFLIRRTYEVALEDVALQREGK